MPPLHGPFLADGPTDAPLTVLLAHGAGAGMDHRFMAASASCVWFCPIAWPTIAHILPLTA